MTTTKVKTPADNLALVAKYERQTLKVLSGEVVSKGQLSGLVSGLKFAEADALWWSQNAAATSCEVCLRSIQNRLSILNNEEVLSSDLQTYVNWLPASFNNQA